MNELQEKMRNKAAELLSSGTAELLLGWQKGFHWWQSYPAFIEDAGQAELLTWDLFCVPNLAKYLLEELPAKQKVALFLKGCDARGFNQLLQDRRVERERVYICGIPCRGLVDPAKVEKAGLNQDLLRVEQQGEELVFISSQAEKKAAAAQFYYDKCLTCRHPNPVVFDCMLGAPVQTAPQDPYTQVKQIETLDTLARFRYWDQQFSRCIRCFACRNVCPACNCRECIFDLNEPRWLGKANTLSENHIYHLIRAFHVAGRCVDCGECARVCPAELPLMSLNRKLSKDLDALYGPYEAGIDPQTPPPLITFNPDDPAAFTES